MLNFRRKVRIETERMTLRLPQHNDWKAWAGLRAESATFLTQWEPVWAGDHLTRRAFTNRVYWAARAEAQGTALPLMLVRREDQMLLGARSRWTISGAGPSQSGTLGYWIGSAHARRGYMREAILAVVHHAFGLDGPQPDRGSLLGPRTPPRAGGAGKMRLQIRRGGAKLSADRGGGVAQPCALRQPARRSARAHGRGLTAGNRGLGYGFLWTTCQTIAF